MKDSRRENEVAGRRVRIAVRFAVLSVIAITLGACGDSTGPVGLQGVSVTAPDQIHFTVQSAGNYRQIVVPVKITNSTSKVIDRVFCSESLEQFHGAGWNAVWSPVCIAIFSVYPIQPGATETVSFTVADSGTYPGFRFTDPENQYRMRIEVVAGGDDGTASFSTRAATNAFQVVP